MPATDPLRSDHGFGSDRTEARKQIAGTLRRRGRIGGVAQGPVVAGDVSERESEVLAAVAEGLTNAEMAQRLHISVRTVESHVSALLRKLGQPDRRALARKARTAAVVAAGGDADSGLQGAPAALSSFVGRGAELVSLVEALETARWVSLVGPGGVGKTRLAVETGAKAAIESPGAAWYVDLVPVRAGAVVTAVAAAVGVTERPNRSLEEVVAEALGPRPALLVVDNCEHVLEPVAALLERLLAACPGLRILTTSRELFGSAGERVVPIGPLASEEAVRLFVERAQSLDPGFGEPSDFRTVADVCDRLDRMPLAIELASARCAVLGLDGVRTAMRDRLRLLTGTRRANERHRSLRAVLDWSHELLDADEQATLRRLAVFAGDFSAADAAVVAGEGIGEHAVIEAVGGLTGKSLLVRRRRGSTSVYRLLETVRDYAGERLAERGEADGVRHRHLMWVRDAAVAAERRLVGGEAWRPNFDAVADDARVALAWASGSTGAAAAAADAEALAAEGHQLARAHAHLAYARRFLSEAQACYEQAAGLAADDRGAAADLRAAGAVAFARMRGDLAYVNHLAAGERALLGGDPATAAMALADGASLATRCPAEFTDSPGRSTVGELLSRARSLDPGDDPQVTAHLAVAEAWVALAQPPPADAPTRATAALARPADLALARAAVAAARAVDDLPLLSGALDAETVALWHLGRVAESLEVVTDRLALLDRLARHDPRTGGEVFDTFHMAAETSLSAGRITEALDRAMRMRKDELAETSPFGAARQAVIALALLGRFTEAVAEAQAMRVEWERAGRPSAGWMAPATIAAQLAFVLLGRHEDAADWERVTEQVSTGVSWSSPETFRAFATARVALHEGRIEDALAAVDGFGTAWSGPYIGYATAIAAEIAVVAGADDAADRVTRARADLAENHWSHACLLRAEARLHRDPSRMRAALDAFDAIDARFEWAVTGLLVGGEMADQALAALADIGAAPPR